MYQQIGGLVSNPRFPDLYGKGPLRSAGGCVCTRKGKIRGFKQHQAAALALAFAARTNAGSALPFIYLSKFGGCFSFQSISSKRPAIIVADILTF